MVFRVTYRLITCSSHFPTEEIDAVPVRAWWIEQLLLETVETKTATASAIRGSGYRGLEVPKM
jgi:hypothetical protein